MKARDAAASLAWWDGGLPSARALGDWVSCIHYKGVFLQASKLLELQVAFLCLVSRDCRPVGSDGRVLLCLTTSWCL